MEIVDGNSAGGMCAESAQLRGFPASLFAIGAPGKDSDFFANALKNAIREYGNEGVTIGEPPDSRKTFDAASSNAAPGSIMPHLIEGQSWLKVLQNGNDASHEAFLTAIDINTKSPPIVAGELMQAVAVQVDGETGIPIPAGDIVDTAASEYGAGSVQWMLPGSMSVSAATIDAIDTQQQLSVPAGDGNVVAVSNGTPAVSEEIPTGGLLLGIALPDGAQGSGSPTTHGVGDLVLKQEGVRSQDIPVIPVESMPPTRGGPTFLFPEAQVWAPDPDGVSLFGDVQTVPTPENASSAGPEMAMAAKDLIVVANHFGGQKSHETMAGFTPDAFPSVALEASVLNSVPEHATYSEAKGALNIGHAQLFDQLVQGVRVAQNTGGTEVLVHLKPDFLGRLSIRAMSDDHGIHIEIRAENGVVRQVMQDNLADLRQWLTDRNLAFNQLSILADTGWHSRREPQWLPQGSSLWSDAEPEMPAEMAVESIPHVQNGTIDYFA